MRSMRVVGSCLCAVLVAVGGGLATASSANAVAPRDCGLPQFYTNGTVGPVTCTDGSPSKLAGKIIQLSSPRVMALGRSASWVQIREAICDDIQISFATLPMAVDGYDYQFVRFDWEGARPWPGTVHYRLAMGGVCE